MDEIDVPADTQPDAALPPRPGHGARPLDDSVEEASWRDLPPVARAVAEEPLPPAAPRRPALRRRLLWWLFALLLATLLGAAMHVFAPEPPPCGDRLFIPSSEGGGCVDPALLRR